MRQNKLAEVKIYIYNILRQVDDRQARRYHKLEYPALAIASKGILRHFRAWHRDAHTEAELISRVDPNAIREIIDDASKGEEVFAHANDDTVTDFTAKNNPKLPES